MVLRDVPDEVWLGLSVGFTQLALHAVAADGVVEAMALRYADHHLHGHVAWFVG